MTTFRSPRLLAYVLMVSGGVIVAAAIGRPEPLLIGVPFLVVLAAVGLFGRSRADFEVHITIDRAKVLEGEEIEFEFEVTCRSGRFVVAFLPDLPAAFELVEPPTTTAVSANRPTTMRGRLRCLRWGAHLIGGGTFQARDYVSAFVHRQFIEPTLAVRVYPRPQRLRSVLRPQRLRPRFGSLVSRAAGTGLEFADIREFARGDERRHVNWKATARRNQLHVNLFHTERSSDVVLLLDTFTDVVGDSASSLELGVRAVTSIAMQCLRRRDRVGLLAVGGTMRWLLPGMGSRQLYRIVDSLMLTQLSFNYSWSNLETIPQRALPSSALVIALTPLADRRTLVMLLDLHARGHDMAVVEISADSPPPLDSSSRCSAAPIFGERSANIHLAA